MSYISKMMIMGVRAFPTQVGETIKFEPPLTLVAGINGSGKTTIIEALRFATTGALPPGASLKGAWIHDPGLEGQKEVLAQVKLMFFSANGTRLVATRNIQLSIKKGTNTRAQKTLEASLLIERHGQKTTLSTRVAELDQQVPLYLGVTPSLLDNVLFCHQEDSQWPLAESGTLKKKFDEIFEAGKYTKAVKELQLIRKKHKADLGRQEEVANSAEKDKNRARKVQKETEALKSAIEELRIRARDLQEKMNNAQTRANEAWQEAEGHGQVLNRLEQRRGEVSSTEKSLENLRVHLKESPESDEWLQNMLAQFDDNLARYQENRDAKKEQFLEYEDELGELKERLDTKLSEQGSHRQEKLEHERRLEHRKSQIKESAIKHQIRGFDDLSDESKVGEFSAKIKKLSKDRSVKLDQARMEADRQKDEAITLVNTLSARQVALKESRTSASHQIADNNHQAGQRQKEADSINVDEGSRAAIETRMEELETRLSSTRASSKTADYTTKIKQANLEVSRLEDQMNDLTQEQMQASKRAGEVAQLSHVKQQTKEKERSLITLLRTHQNRINGLLGNEWSPETLENKYRAAVSDAAKDVATVEHERDSFIREADQVHYKQNTLRKELNNRKRQAREHEENIKSVVDGDVTEYEDVLKQSEIQLDSARERMQEYGGLGPYFETVLEVAENKCACRVCERPFKNASDPLLKKFKTRLQVLIKRAAAEEVEKEIQAATEDHKRLTDVAVSYETWKRLTSQEIPSIDEDLAQLGKDHEKLSTKIENCDKKVEERQSAQKEAESIAPTVSSIVKTAQEIQELTAKVDELTVKQSQHGDVKTLEDLQELINDIKARTQDSRAAVSRLTNEENTARSENYAMELELRELRNELEHVSRQLDRKISLLDRVQEYKGLNQKQRDIIDKVDTDMETIISDIDIAKAKRDDVDQRANTQLRELAEEARGIDETVNALSLINSQIRAYIEAGGASNLSRTIREIERIREEITNHEAARTQVMKEIAKVDEQLRDSDNTRRHYADNLRFRQESKHLKWLRDEIEELESKNAEHDYQRLQQESEQQTKNYHKYSGQREGIVAEMTVQDRQLKKLLDEFQTDLKDAALRFKEAHIKVESTKAAVEDIGKYSNALDQAVTKYHTLKMDQVNSIMEELWRATYMGTDVDTIYIKSDLEVKANSRSHNYRVVMLKRDVELDMRGRCSAGQKVLASIIIRLALAECFSKDCGVIALDEPTTNLDEKNIEALAVSLHRIIETRRHQKNFQLIIITHDEHFLELMNCADFTDHYWRVSRNKDDDSIIEKQSILAVMRK